MKKFFLFLTLLTLSVGQMWGASATWALVTSEPSDWSGEYLFVYNAVCFNGDATTLDQSTGQSVTISNNKITLDDKYSVTVAKSGTKYSLKTASGYYFGRNANSNGLDASTTWNNNYTVTFSNWNSTNHTVKIAGNGGRCLGRNGNPWRFFSSSNAYVNLSLYKKEVSTYTITASSNNNSWGTVSVSGTTITATPADCYQVASGTSGYNKVSGTATITHTENSNTISVTPSTNCSIQVIFEKKIVNTYVDEIQGNDDIEACGLHEAPSLDDKDVASSGSCAQQHWHFMGWVTSDNKATPTDLNIIAPETEMTADGKTYYAVWAKGTGSDGFDGTHGGTFKIYANVSGTKYYATSTISSGKFGRTTDASSAAEFTIEAVSGGFTIKLGNNYVYYTGSTNLGTQNSSYTWTFASGVKGTWRANSATSGRGFIYRDGTGFGGYSTGNVTAGGSEYFDLEIGGGYEYSDYKAVCCTELGSINGSVSVTNDGCGAGELKATWRTNSEGLDGIASQTVKVYRADNNNEVTGLTDLTGNTAQTTNQTVTISGLTPCVEYYVKIWNVSKGGSYCESDFAGEKSSNVAAASYTITKTGVTNVTAESLSAIPATTCASGFNATIVAASGYDLPGTITVTGANHTWDQATGALTISNVTDNVVITITPTEAQCTPLTAPSVSVSGKDYPYDAVTLSWTAVEHADGYTVEIYDGEDKIEDDNLDSGADSYTITKTLAANKTYTYKVKATSETPATYCESDWATDNFATADYPTVTLFYSENGELSAGVDQQILTDFTLPNEAAECSKTFIGWTTQSSYSHASAAPDPFMEKGSTWQIPTNAKCTLYAVYADVVEAFTTWDKTAISSLGASDVFVIVGDNDNNYAMTNDNGTNNPPAATSITITDEKLSNAPADNLKWNISGNATDGYTFYPNGSTTTWLYCTNTNNGVRVGDNANKVFEIKDGYLYHKGTSRYVGIYNSQDWRCYTSINDNIKDQTFTFYKKNVTEASVTNYVTICQGKVAKPVISGVAEGTTYEEAKTITITSATTGATIYYTTDGTEPTTSSNAYSAPFEVSANGDYTIRAIAVKDEMVNSDEATAVSFTLDLPFTTIASFIEAAPSTAKKLVFTAESNARVLAYNKNRIYIQDGTGAMFLYNTGSNNGGHGKTWASGKKIVGTLTGTYSLTNNMPRMTVTDFGATDVTADAIELPTPIAVEALETNFASNVCKLVTINGVSIRSESVADNKTIDMTKNNVTYNIYNAFNVLTGHTLPLNTTTCTVTGILGQSNSGNTLQLMPISADGISTNGAEAVLPVLSVTGSTNSAEPFEVATNKEITFTPNSNFDAVYAINDGEEAAVGNSTNVTITDEVNATKVYIKATREYYTDKEVTYYYLANPALIEYDITKSSMSHGSATIQNAQGDAITYAVGGATVTLVANPAEHYHWVSWNVTAGGEPVTVTNNTFEMPNAAVTVSATFEEDDYATVAFAKGNAGVTGDAPVSQKVYVGENATMPGKGSMILSSHNFAGWKLGNNAVLNTGDTYTVTAEDHEAGTITFEAQWEPYPWAAGGDWVLVTDVAELTEGSYVIIAAAASNVAISITQNNNNRAQQAISKSDNTLTYGETAPAIFEVQAGNTIGGDPTLAFYDVALNGYIYAASSSSNWLRTEETLSNNSSWVVEISDGIAEMQAQGTNSRDKLQYNSTNNPPIFSCYADFDKASIALYKYYAPVPKVTYDKNTTDEVTNMPNPSVQRAENNKAVIAAGPSRTGYTFEGWNSAAEGNGNAYTVGQEYTFTEDITLYAQWDALPSFHVTYNTSGSQGTTPTDATDYYEGDEVTLASASGLSNAGYFFDKWVATYVDGNSDIQTLDIEDNKFTMPAFDVTVTATWARKSSDKWIKVTEVSQLVADKEYIIVNTDATYAVGAQGSNNRTAAAIEENNGILTISDAVAKFTLGIPEENKYTFYQNGTVDNVDKGYLYAAASDKNYMRTQVENNANDVWTISMDENGAATVTATGTNTRNIMRYNPNNGSPVFSCYASSSTVQNPVVLYYKAPKIEINDNESVNVSDAAGSDIVIHDGGTLNVDADKQIGDLTVEAGGKVVLDENKLTVVGTFTIETTMASGASGQLIGATASNFATNGPAYIDITLGAGGRADHWHAITVPFPVDAINGIYDLDGNKLNNEEHYAIMEYLGNVRAQGKYGWKKYRKILVPGTFYLMTVDGGRTTYRFMKTSDGALVAGNSKEIFEYAKSGEGQTTDAGWNGVGNPTLVYGKVNAEVQVLDPENYVYVKKDPNSTNFVVGTPFFYQADAAGSISMLTADAGANYAPARIAANGIEKIKVSFGNEEYTDYLDISASEEAKNEYQIGKDLVKMTMTNTPSVAQIFGNAYNAKLCMVYAPMVNDKATFDLTLYAPAAGTYTIAAPSMENATLYLTKNGRIYWNLTMGACELDLNQGQNNEYGLVLRAEVPAVTTGIENGGMLNGENGVQKVVIDEHVYILRGGEMYDMTGKIVK